MVNVPRKFLPCFMSLLFIVSVATAQVKKPVRVASPTAPATDSASGGQKSGVERHAAPGVNTPPQTTVAREEVEPRVVDGTGTTNRIVKWIDGASGSIGDSSITEINGLTVFGQASPLFPNASNFHVVEIVAPGTRTPLTLVGGSGSMEFWKDLGGGIGAPSRAVAFGTARPGTTATDDMVFSTYADGAGWFERMRITNGGNVGIGATNPGSRLTVAGVIESMGGGFRFPDGTVQTTAASPGGGLTLPFNGTTNSASHAFEVTNQGAGAGLRGNSTSGTGVIGSGTTGVFGTSAAASGAGVSGSASGVMSYGVAGTTSSGGGAGVYGTTTAPTGTGVLGTGNFGVNGIGNIGVYGASLMPSGTGVYGTGVTGGFGLSEDTNGTGILGDVIGGGAPRGVWGIADSPGFAGYFDGNVNVTGSVSKAGGSFKIDHPLDPANRYLYHSFVESPDMLNIYNGNITTDADGTATVVMPEYFDTLNRDFRYQLTVIGQFAQAIVATKIDKNRFTIKTDKPNVEVSWQVTGIRQDAYANTHRIPVEEDKPERERGSYLHPEAFGQPAEKGVEWVLRPEQMRERKEKAARRAAQQAP